MFFRLNANTAPPVPAFASSKPLSCLLIDVSALRRCQRVSCLKLRSARGNCDTRPVPMGYSEGRGSPGRWEEWRGGLLGSSQRPRQVLRRLQGEAGKAQGPPTITAGIRFALQARRAVRPGMRGLDANRDHLEPRTPTLLVHLAKDGYIPLPLDVGIAKHAVFKVGQQRLHSIPLFGVRGANLRRGTTWNVWRDSGAPRWGSLVPLCDTILPSLTL